MFVFDAPPPAIIQPGEPWEIWLGIELARRGVPLFVRIDILREIKRVQANVLSLRMLKPTLDDLKRFGGLPLLGFIPGMTGPMAGAAGSALWTPASLPSLRLWLDGHDAATVTTANSAVSQWNDKSGNGYNLTQATSGDRPSHSTTTGLLTFDGTSDCLAGSASIFGTGSFSYLIGIVATTTTITGERMISWAGTNATRQSLHISLPGATTSLRHGWYADDLNGGAISTNTQFIAVIAYDGTAKSNWVNGPASASVSGAPGGALNLASNAFYIARGFTAAGFWSGTIGEYVVAKAYLAADREKLEGYLAHRWGMQNLLHASHPFRTRPP